jgi:ElaB/YqjD/DUF883 family membrane-anchored ribosome-binding protein
MKSRRKPTLETLGEDLAVLRGDIAQVADTVALLAEQTARSQISQARSAADGVADDARSLLESANAEMRAALDGLKSIGRSAVGQARSRALDGKEEIEGVIERYPFAAIGVAAAVGFMLALSARHRRSDH